MSTETACKECRKRPVTDIDEAQAVHALYHGFPWWHRLFCSSCRAHRRESPP